MKKRDLDEYELENFINTKIKYIKKEKSKKILSMKYKYLSRKRIEYKNTFFIIGLLLLIILLLLLIIFIFSELLFDKNGEKIYLKKGTISFNKLDKKYFFKKFYYSKFNHIHLAMSFDNDYHLLSSVTIASLLKNSSPTTYIHLHIISFKGWNFSTMAKLNSLKYKINNNTEFIFHNGDKALKDFGNDIINESKGIGEYARLLAPNFVKEADRLIITDSADIYFEKDLLELYNYPLEGKFVKGIVDPYTPCYPDFTFFTKENYFNGGVLLVDAKLWRKMGLYEDIVNLYKGFHYNGTLPTPIQDILNHFFPSITVGNLPIRYNLQGYANKDGDDYPPYNDIYQRDCSIFYNKRDEIIKEEKNLVVRHTNKFKAYDGDAYEDLRKEWNDNAKLTGFYDEICRKYPNGCIS